MAGSVGGAAFNRCCSPSSPTCDAGMGSASECTGAGAANACPLRIVLVQVDEDEGAGLDLLASEHGMEVVQMFDFPGQKGVHVGDTIVSIDKRPLDRRSCGDSEVQDATFAESLRHGATLEVLESCEEPVGVVRFRCPRCWRGYASWQPCLEHLTAVWRQEKQAKDADDEMSEAQPSAHEIRLWMQRASAAAVGELPRPCKSAQAKTVSLCGNQQPIRPAGRTDEIVAPVEQSLPQSRPAQARISTKKWLGDSSEDDEIVPAPTTSAFNAALNDSSRPKDSGPAPCLEGRLSTSSSTAGAPALPETIPASLQQAPSTLSSSCSSGRNSDLDVRVAADRARRIAAIPDALATHGAPVAPVAPNALVTGGAPQELDGDKDAMVSSSCATPSSLGFCLSSSTSLTAGTKSTSGLDCQAPPVPSAMPRFSRQCAGQQQATMTTVVTRTIIANTDGRSEHLGGVAGLAETLEVSHLSRCNEAAAAWCDEQGPVSLDEILDFFDDFAQALSLRPLEKQRLQKRMWTAATGMVPNGRPSLAQPVFAPMLPVSSSSAASLAAQSRDDAARHQDVQAVDVSTVPRVAPQQAEAIDGVSSSGASAVAAQQTAAMHSGGYPGHRADARVPVEADDSAEVRGVPEMPCVVAPGSSEPAHVANLSCGAAAPRIQEHVRSEAAEEDSFTDENYKEESRSSRALAARGVRLRSGRSRRSSCPPFMSAQERAGLTAVDVDMERATGEDVCFAAGGAVASSNTGASAAPSRGSRGPSSEWGAIVPTTPARSFRRGGGGFFESPSADVVASTDSAAPGSSSQRGRPSRPADVLGRARSASRAARARSSSIRARRPPPPQRTWWGKHFEFKRLRAAGAGAAALRVNLSRMQIHDPDVRSIVAGIDVLLDDLRAELATDVGGCEIPLRLKLEIDLSENSIGDDGASCLFRWLLARRSDIRCRSLKLARNNLGDDAFLWLAEFIRLQHSALEEVHLSHNRADERGVAALLLSMAHHPNDAYPWLNRRGVFVPAWVTLDGNAVRDPGALCGQLRLLGLRFCNAKADIDGKGRARRTGANQPCQILRCAQQSQRFEDSPHVHLPVFSDARAVSPTAVALPQGLVERVGRVREGGDWSPPVNVGILQAPSAVAGAVGTGVVALPANRDRPPAPPRREFLLVDEDYGAGIELEPIENGLRVTEITSFPGQPGLRVGDVVAAVDGWPLSTRACGSGDDAQNDRFGSRFRHGAVLDILSIAGNAASSTASPGGKGGNKGSKSAKGQAAGPTNLAASQHVAASSARFRCPGCWEEFDYWRPCLTHLRETKHIPDLPGKRHENEAACLRRWMGDCVAAARGEIGPPAHVQSSGHVAATGAGSETPSAMQAMLLRAAVADGSRCQPMVDSLVSDAVKCGENHRCTVWIQRDGFEVFGADTTAVNEAVKELQEVMRFYLPELKISTSTSEARVVGASVRFANSAQEALDFVTWVQCMARQREDGDAAPEIGETGDVDEDDEEANGLVAAGAGTPLNAAAPPFVPRGVTFSVSMLRVLLMCGLPGAGKSTVAERLRADFGWQVVNQDTLGSRQACMKVIRDLLRSPETRVVVDRCNIDVAQRAMWVQLASQEFGFTALQLGCVWLATRPEECGRRVMQRFEHKTLPASASSLRVIRGFADSFEPPCNEEGFGRIWKITGDLDAELFWADFKSLNPSSSYGDTSAYLRSSEANAESEAPPSRQQVSPTNNVWQADVDETAACEAALEKLEVCLGDASVLADATLRAEIESADDGWLQIDSLLSRPDVRTDGANSAIVAEALKGHPDLEAHRFGSRLCIRRRRPLPLVENQEQNAVPSAGHASKIESVSQGSIHAVAWDAEVGHWVPCRIRELELQNAAGNVAQPSSLPVSAKHDPAADFRPGQCVRVIGVVSRPELNDTIVELTSYDADKGRWRVRVGDTEIALKPTNFEQVVDFSHAAGVTRDGQDAPHPPERQEAKPSRSQAEAVETVGTEPPVEKQKDTPPPAQAEVVEMVGTEHWPEQRETIASVPHVEIARPPSGEPAAETPQSATVPSAIAAEHVADASQANENFAAQKGNVVDAYFWRVPLPDVLSDEDDANKDKIGGDSACSPHVPEQEQTIELSVATDPQTHAPSDALERQQPSAIGQGFSEQPSVDPPTATGLEARSSGETEELQQQASEAADVARPQSGMCHGIAAQAAVVNDAGMPPEGVLFQEKKKGFGFFSGFLGMFASDSRRTSASSSASKANLPPVVGGHCASGGAPAFSSGSASEQQIASPPCVGNTSDVLNTDTPPRDERLEHFSQVDEHTPLGNQQVVEPSPLVVQTPSIGAGFWSVPLPALSEDEDDGHSPSL